MRLRTGIDCCKKIRVVSMIDFRQEADGRDVASEGRKLERRTSRVQQRREPSRMNECPRGDLGGKRKRGEEEEGRRGRDWNAGGGQHHVPVVNTQPRGQGRNRSRNSNCAIIMDWLKVRV